MVAYNILTEYFLGILVQNCIVGILLTCPITLQRSYIIITILYFTDGKKRGFAFVSLTTHESADKVVSELKSVSDRPVAVDWAVDKDKYQLKTTSSDKSTNNNTGMVKRIWPIQGRV